MRTRSGPGFAAKARLWVLLLVPTGCADRVIDGTGDGGVANTGDAAEDGGFADDDTGTEPPDEPDLPPEPPEPESCFFCDEHEYCIWLCHIEGGYHGHICTTDPELSCPEGYDEAPCAFPSDLSCMSIDP